MDLSNAPLLSSAPDFPKLHPELVKSVDTAEIELRRVMQQLLVEKLGLPLNAIAEAQHIVIGTPADLLRTMLPLLGMLSGIMDQLEMQARLQASGGKRTVN